MTEIEPMDEARAREIIGSDFIGMDNSLWLDGAPAGGDGTTIDRPTWHPRYGAEGRINVTGDADELEAIAWWMRAHA